MRTLNEVLGRLTAGVELLQREDFEELFLGAGPASTAAKRDEEENEQR
jgi:hypothetical protein